MLCNLYNNAAVLIWVVLVSAMCTSALKCGRPALAHNTFSVVENGKARFYCADSDNTTEWQLIGPSVVRCGGQNKHYLPPSPFCVINAIFNSGIRIYNNRYSIQMNRPLNKSVLYVVVQEHVPLAVALELINPHPTVGFACHYNLELSSKFNDTNGQSFYICTIQAPPTPDIIELDLVLHFEEPVNNVSVVAFWGPLHKNCNIPPLFWQCHNRRISFIESAPMILVETPNNSYSLFVDGKEESHSLISCDPMLSIWQWIPATYECRKKTKEPSMVPKVGRKESPRVASNTSIKYINNSDTGADDDDGAPTRFEVSPTLVPIKVAPFNDGVSKAAPISPTTPNVAPIQSHGIYVNDQPHNNEPVEKTAPPHKEKHDTTEQPQKHLISVTGIETTAKPKTPSLVNWDIIKQIVNQEIAKNTNLGADIPVDDMWWTNPTFIYSMLSVLCTTLVTICIRLCCKCCPTRCKRAANQMIVEREGKYTPNGTFRRAGHLMAPSDKTSIEMAPLHKTTAEIHHDHHKDAHAGTHSKDKKIIIKLTKAGHNYQPAMKGISNAAADTIQNV